MKPRLARPRWRLLMACGLVSCAAMSLAEWEWIGAWLEQAGVPRSAQAQSESGPQSSAVWDPWPVQTPTPATDAQIAPQAPIAQAEPQPAAAEFVPDDGVVSPAVEPFLAEAASAPDHNQRREADSATSQLPPDEPQEAAATGDKRMALRWVIPNAVNLGQEATFGLVVTNTATDGADAVAVQVKLPQNALLGQCVPPPTSARTDDMSQPLVWQLGPMAPGANKTIHLGLTPASAGKLTPAAAVAVTRIAETSVAVLEPLVDLTIAGPAHVVVGQRITYQVNVSNRGTGAAAHVLVEAHVPAGLGADPGAQLRYQVGALAAGETRQIDLPVQGLAEGNHEIGAAVQALGAAAKRTGHVVQVVAPALTLAIDGPKLRYLERQATYVINVENPSPIAVHNVQVFNRVPEGFRFVEATDGGSFNSQVRQVAWFVGRLEPHSTATVAAKLVPSTLGEHTIAAAVRADAGVARQTETATRVEGISSVAIDVSDRDDPVEVQGETVYTIRVSNHGSKQAAGVQVAAVLGEQLQVTATDGPTDGAVEGEQVVFAPLATLAPGETREYRVHVRCHSPGSTRFRAFLRTADIAEPVIEEEQTRVYED